MKISKPKVSSEVFVLIESLNDLRKESSRKRADIGVEVERLRLEIILSRNKCKAMFKVMVLACGVGLFSMVVAMLSLAGFIL